MVPILFTLKLLIAVVSHWASYKMNGPPGGINFLTHHIFLKQYKVKALGEFK